MRIEGFLGLGRARLGFGISRDLRLVTVIWDRAGVFPGWVFDPSCFQTQAFISKALHVGLGSWI